MPFQEPTIVTPPFPEYVSGHSTFSAAGDYILQQVTGFDLFGDSYIAGPGSSHIEPGITPIGADFRKEGGEKSKTELIYEKVDGKATHPICLLRRSHVKQEVS